MTLTELRYIVELADTRHVGRAAQRCNVSQPNLSVSVKKLEEALGVVLFERTKSGVHPTPLGQGIIAQARRVLQSMEGIQQLADAGRDQLGDPLRLGVIYTVAPYLLPQLIPFVQQQAPAMPLVVQEDVTAHLGQQLRDGTLDAMLVSLPFAQADVVVQALYDEPLVAILPQAHPLAARATIDATALAGQPLLLLADGHCLRAQVLALLPELASVPLPGARINSLETLRYMVAAGQGLAIVPRSAATPSVCLANRLVARPLDIPGAERTLALAWRASFPRHKAIDVLRRSIQACSGAYWRFTTEPDSAEQSLLGVQGY
ncbi:hydrogen peroxide-inducible genes activator [Cellvibrio sp. PSBB023]|uniref:hydrogen peroxide-inducible genes activator n=1 Tax=Cellvibrio sp. PSBB023 TaxID=1945512 RepID=UPI00098F1932|nr:hydrogen peroxide-inducible genes activator [Cellvibrio sp. PSBB023]AQT60647.1 LysR family transcriptional regulator [Cellvibrio sp. PSBB023]